MDTLLLKAFLLEFILAFFILFQLTYNYHFWYARCYKFIPSNKELFFQVIFILISITALVLNVGIEGTFSNGVFFTNKILSLLIFFFLLVLFFYCNYLKWWDFFT